MNFSNLLYFILITALVSLPLSIAAPSITYAQDTELVFDAKKNKWVRRPAGEIKKAALKRWANISPIPRETVLVDRKLGKGTILISTDERRLYYGLGNGKAVKYAIGVGREGFEWKGTERITRKAEWPSWTPPPEMRRREAKEGRILPLKMKGGIDNPLGARALYLGSTYYRIHGTNQPWTIGKAVSSGCIRMANEDVVHLFKVARIGTKVIVE